MSLPNTSLDLSAFGLFLRADIFVQIIMVGLIIASIVCWAIIIDKSIALKKIRRDINEFENLFDISDPKMATNEPTAIMTP